MKADLMTMGFLLAGGMISGVLFDFYRMLRREGRWNQIATFCGDLVFSLLVLGILVFFFRKANYLEFRMYLFIASLTGLAIYLVLLSKCVKVLFARFFSVTQYTGRALSIRVKAFLRGFYMFIRFLLSVPYGILRWLGLLVYRFGEAVFRGFSLRAEKKSNNINKRTEGKQKKKLQEKLLKQEMKKQKQVYHGKSRRKRKD